MIDNAGNVSISDDYIHKGKSNKVTVTFNANGGSFSEGVKTYTIGSPYGSIITSPTPEKTNYDFVGWYTRISGGSKIESSTIVSNSSDHSLYAHWRGIGVNVTFDANGGSTPVSNKVVYYKETYGTLPIPSKENYTFKGWYTDISNGTQVKASTNVNLATNHILHAIWEESSYTVKYVKSRLPDEYTEVQYIESDGGQFIRTSIVPQNNMGIYMKVSSSSISNDLTYIGSKKDSNSRYSIGNQSGTLYFGFNSIATADSIVADDINIIKMNYLNDRTLNHNGLPYKTQIESLNNNNYPIIIFGGNDGGTVNYKSSIRLYELKISKGSEVAYEFVPCYEKSTGNIGLFELTKGAFYTNNGTGTFKKGDDLVTGEIADQILVVGTSKALNKNVFEKEGYTYQNWNTKMDGTGKIYSDEEEVLNMTDVPGTTVCLYPIWSKDTITVSFNGNGGSVSSSSKTVRPFETYGTLPTPTRSDYIFTGWYTSSSGGRRIETSSIVTNPSTHTLYAHWTSSSITVTFDANGGTVSLPSKQVSIGGTYGAMPTPTYNGYDFVGWYTLPNSGTKVETTTNVTSENNHTLYAHWITHVNRVTINLDWNFAMTTSDSLHPESVELPIGDTYEGLPEDPIFTQEARQANAFSDVFAGWYFNETGDEIDIYHSDNIPQSITDRDIIENNSMHTVHAGWYYYIPCSDCDGTGHINNENCTTCMGTGEMLFLKWINNEY